MEVQLLALLGNCNRPTDRKTSWRTGGPIEKLHFKNFVIYLNSVTLLFIDSVALLLIHCVADRLISNKQTKISFHFLFVTKLICNEKRKKTYTGYP